MDTDVPVLAVDGPSGTGKGTLGAGIALHLGWNFLDSGALYRTAALLAMEQNTDLDSGPTLARLAGGMQVRFELVAGPEGVRVLLGSRDVSDAIRSEECGSAASQVARLPEVRGTLLSLQHGFRKRPGLVADGRDMGTVVFPDAFLKVFLTASAEERAKRRYKQLKLKGISVSLPRLSADIASRDARDEGRSLSPTRPADDAVVIDTTRLDESQVREQVLDLLSGRRRH